MILEIAEFSIDENRTQAFESDIEAGLTTVITKAKGYIKHELHHSKETPQRYVLHIYWQTLENHTIDFRESDAFQTWRSIISPYFVRPPLVEHFDTIISS